MRRAEGLTLIELLMAMAVVGIVMVVVVVFFAFQSRTTTRVQGSNEMNVRLRSVAEIVAKDLQLTGGQAVVVGGRPSYINQVRLICDPPVDETGTPDPSGDPNGTNADCIQVNAGTGEVTLVYASSLWPDGLRCRKIVYHYDAPTATVHRADLECAEASPATWTFSSEFAAGISGFSMEFTCELVDADGDGTLDPRLTVSDPADCYDAGSYVRTGTVIVSGTSDRPFGLANSLSLSTNMPNVRNPINFGAAQ